MKSTEQIANHITKLVGANCIDNQGKLNEELARCLVAQAIAIWSMPYDSSEGHETVPDLP